MQISCFNDYHLDVNLFSLGYKHKIGNYKAKVRRAICIPS